MDIYTDASVRKERVGLGIHVGNREIKIHIPYKMKNTDAEKVAILVAVNLFGREHTYFTDCLVYARQFRDVEGLNIHWIPRRLNKADRTARFARTSSGLEPVIDQSILDRIIKEFSA